MKHDMWGGGQKLNSHIFFANFLLTEALRSGLRVKGRLDLCHPHSVIPCSMMVKTAMKEQQSVNVVFEFYIQSTFGL